MRSRFDNRIRDETLRIKHLIESALQDFKMGFVEEAKAKNNV